jgi:hypothetical protein
MGQGRWPWVDRERLTMEGGAVVPPPYKEGAIFRAIDNRQSTIVDAATKLDEYL